MLLDAIFFKSVCLVLFGYLLFRKVVVQGKGGIWDFLLFHAHDIWSNFPFLDWSCDQNINLNWFSVMFFCSQFKIDFGHTSIQFQSGNKFLWTLPLQGQNLSKAKSRQLLHGRDHLDLHAYFSYTSWQREAGQLSILVNIFQEKHQNIQAQID